MRLRRSLGSSGNLDQAAPLQRLQRGGEGGSIHGEQGSDRPHCRRLGAIERHQQGELSVGEFEGAKFFVEAPAKGARRTLHMEAKTSVLDHQCCLEGQRFCT